MSASRTFVIAALIFVGTLPSPPAAAPPVTQSAATIVLQGFSGEAARVSCGDEVMKHGLRRAPGTRITSFE